MQLFYSTSIHENTVLLDETESRHAIKVLRRREGDEVSVMDGRGGLYTGIIEKADPGGVEMKIREKQYFDPPERKLHIALAPTKNMDRMEWMVEKTVEIGVSEIQFVLSKHSERRKLKIERLERIALSAAKQSGTWHLPELGELCELDDVLSHKFDEGTGLYIATLGDGQRDWRKVPPRNSDNWVLIGPEGDFHATEIEKAKAYGFIPLSLGAKRLRTETAVIQACSWFAFSG